MLSIVHSSRLSDLYSSSQCEGLQFLLCSSKDRDRRPHRSSGIMVSPERSETVHSFKLPDEEERIPAIDLTETPCALTQSPCEDLSLQVQDVEQHVEPRCEKLSQMQGNELSQTQIGYNPDSARTTCESLLLPVRDGNTHLYTDGKYKAASLKMHFNPTSIPMLDTPEDGMLHIITGWASSEVLSDLCYRYETWGMWESRRCGFLGLEKHFRKRAYKCNGVLACPILLKSGNTFQHSTEKEWCALQSLTKNERKCDDMVEMKTARNLYVTLTKPSADFCQARVLSEDRSDSNSFGNVMKCDGTPIMRKVLATGESFVGCSHYFKYRNVRPRHFFLSLRNLTDKAKEYLRNMLIRKKEMDIPGDICEYVAVKKGRSTKRCNTHGVDLVECGTGSSEVGKCSAKILLIEPMFQSSVGNNSPKIDITYAICVGAHNHPPPPQGESTSKKMSIFRNIARASPMTVPAVLKLKTQVALRSGVSNSLQNLKLSRNVTYNTLKAIRNRKEQDEFRSLFEMVGNSDFPYARDVRIVDGGYVFLLASRLMLRQAELASVFAGDATYKTVAERNPHQTTPTWYLYNIVSPEDSTTTTQKGVVVCRALITRITTEAYTALWGMFLKAMREEKSKRLGIRFNDVPIDVPYMELEPERKGNAILVRAITTDFELAEVEGIAAAFAEHRGGSRETHISSLLIGCRIHYERAMLKRAVSMTESIRGQFKRACRLLRLAKTVQEGDEQFAIIDYTDEEWGAWLSHSHVRPLVSSSYSNMSGFDRMLALDTTNIVESQNRRGNLICGVGLDPVLCCNRLFELDSMSSILVNMGNGGHEQKLPRVRTRKGHTLAPSSTLKGSRGPQNSKTKKRKAGEGRGAPRPRKKGHEKEALAELIDMTMTDASSPPAEKGSNNVASEKCSEQLSWLHEDLGVRCHRAATSGNARLFMAISSMYRFVLECNDLNKVKDHILSTMQEQSKTNFDSQIIGELTDILVMTTKQKTATKRTVEYTKLEDITQVKGNTACTSNETDREPEIVCLE